jgi:hypothetical protein
MFTIWESVLKKFVKIDIPQECYYRSKLSDVLLLILSAVHKNDKVPRDNLFIIS